jgi:hypothetical protein
MEPPFWAAQVDQVMGAATKGLGDIIIVRKLSESLYAKLLIVEIGKGFIRTIKVEEARPAIPDAPEHTGLTTRWNVGKSCHVIRVCRQADDGDGLPDQGHRHRMDR